MPDGLSNRVIPTMPPSSSQPSMNGKVCLVTGATAGIGLPTARELARRGARVIGIGRSPERCQQAVTRIREETGAGDVAYLTADLSSQAEIRRLAQEVKDATRRLDVLVNNAGCICIKRQETVDGLEMTFALNHLAYFLLTNLLLDLIRSSAPARIISVASAAHQGCTMNFDDLQGKTRFSGWRAYQQSKLANILFTCELARRLEGTGVTANALHPGYVKTQIFRVEGVPGWLLRRAADLFAISPEEGAKTSIYLASSPEVEGVTGRYFVRQKAVGSSPASLDDATARRLWEVSEEFTGLGAVPAV
jgi:NAD(P)-dependent dehydrogenase (short-subunit alcohol dehydrogenase family)